MSYPTPWAWEAWTVFGGWRIARARWVLDRRTLDKDQEHHFMSDEVFPTREACEAAIPALRDR